ncbi:MAG TPA: glycosyl hydrolase 108 family protein [Candidatus Paceibacterota bacterium]
MRANYPACEKRVLAYEGSAYTDGVHPYDPGGPTRWGITIADARMYWKPGATPDDVKNMPVTVAMDIYKTKYWDKVRGDDLPSGLDETVFDYGVNSGIGRSGKVLRRLCNLPTTTSVIDATVLAAVSKRDVKALITAMNDERMRFLQSLAIWPTYGNGWTKRVNDVKRFSLELADNQPATPIPEPADSKAKGKVKPPDTSKSIIKTIGGGIAAAATAISQWIASHPVQTAVIAAAIIGVIAFTIYLINKNHKARQETPMPGIAPVPERAIT